MSPGTQFLKNLAVGVIVVSAFAGSLAYAQPSESFGEHLSNRLALPTPAAFHARTGELIVGNAAGDVRKIAGSDNGMPRYSGRLHLSRDNSILRLRIDPARDRLWILDIGNVHVIDLAKGRLIRTIALRNWFYASDGTNCLPDLQLDARGAAFVSDNTQPKLWQIGADDFSVHERNVALSSQRSLDVGFSALAVGESGVVFAATAAPGSLWRIDTASFRAEKIALSAPIHGACGIETLGAARSREFTLFVLAAGRGSFEMRRVDMKRGEREARVGTIALGSVTAPATVLARGASLYLATKDAAGSYAGWAQKAPFAMRPLPTLD